MMLPLFLSPDVDALCFTHVPVGSAEVWERRNAGRGDTPEAVELLQRSFLGF